MMRQSRLNPEFVEFIPEQLKEGVLYVSMIHAVASHKCVCGCGNEVVTPLSPTDWQLFFDGKGVSLNPSIGNWSIPCRSHYWIKDNNVDWAGEMPYWAINQGRARNKAVKEQYYASQETPASESAKVQQDFSNASDNSAPEMKQKSWWGVLVDRLFGKR
mgnify:CR=1 FL=1